MLLFSPSTCGFYDRRVHNSIPADAIEVSEAERAAALDALEPVPTLVVTHAGAMRAALHILCGFDQRQLWAFDLPYAVRLTLHIWPGEPRTAQLVELRR